MRAFNRRGIHPASRAGSHTLGADAFFNGDEACDGSIVPWARGQAQTATPRWSNGVQGRGQGFQGRQVLQMPPEIETILRLIPDELSHSQAIVSSNALAQKYEFQKGESNRLILAFLKLSFTSNQNGRGDYL